MAKRSRRPRKGETREAILRSSLRDLRNRDPILIRRSAKTVGTFVGGDITGSGSNLPDLAKRISAILRHCRGYRSGLENRSLSRLLSQGLAAVDRQREPELGVRGQRSRTKSKPATQSSSSSSSSSSFVVVVVVVVLSSITDAGAFCTTTREATLCPPFSV